MSFFSSLQICVRSSSALRRRHLPRIGSPLNRLRHRSLPLLRILRIHRLLFLPELPAVVALFFRRSSRQFVRRPRRRGQEAYGAYNVAHQRPATGVLLQTHRRHRHCLI
ncbi:hypothetical protein LINGRAHAP2_LOCUS19372 [Linum grandiflorum]